MTTPVEKLHHLWGSLELMHGREDVRIRLDELQRPKFPRTRFMDARPNQLPRQHYLTSFYLTSTCAGCNLIALLSRYANSVSALRGIWYFLHSGLAIWAMLRMHPSRPHMQSFADAQRMVLPEKGQSKVGKRNGEERRS